MAIGIINVGKLHNELVEAGILINGCDSNGVVWDNKNNEIQDLEDVAVIINAHDPTPDDTSVLREEYSKAGILTEDMIHALWKKVMSADSVDADALQVKIDQVNLSIS